MGMKLGLTFQRKPDSRCMREKGTEKIFGLKKICGLGSSVGIATGYGLDGPGIESW
jgi:hypothetical protein